ncbi:MAG: sugar phosphate isomerase/epimerase [Clostridia bacterium]|nr:sugar phosphate isomerase/epimerase [Clostridia bacterium]
MFRKSVITDEISQDFETAVKLAKKYNLEGVEIRSVWDTAPEALSEEQISRINNILEQNGLKAVGLSSSIFKCNVKEDETIKIEKSINVAKKLGCKYIRCFSFWKDNNYSDDMFTEILKGCEDKLRDNGLIMLLEFDPAVNITNGRSSARLLKRLNSPFIQAIWDPGNDIYEPFKEIPYPDGYNLIKPFIRHIHIKDAVKKEGKTVGVAFGKGEVDYKGQLKALLNDNYDGFVSMETHYKKEIAISEKMLKNPGGKEFSYLGYESTEECLQNLDGLIDLIMEETV